MRKQSVPEQAKRWEEPFVQNGRHVEGDLGRLSIETPLHAKWWCGLSDSLALYRKALKSPDRSTEASPPPFHLNLQLALSLH